MEIHVTDLKVILQPREDGHYSVYVGSSYEGEIYRTKSGNRWELNYNNRETFSTIEEATIAFLKNKAFLDWDEEE